MPQSRSACPAWLAHYGELIGTWTRRTGDRQNAEDATHDAVVGMLEGHTDAIRDPRAYLHRSIRNRLTDFHRRQGVLEIVPLHELAEDDHPMAADPDTHARSAQLLQDMQTALAELPLKCRQVFVWHRLAGYSQEEIAQRLGVSVNMVQKYMIRAGRHLRERLQRHAPR